MTDLPEQRGMYPGPDDHDDDSTYDLHQCLRVRISAKQHQHAAEETHRVGLSWIWALRGVDSNLPGPACGGVASVER